MRSIFKSDYIPYGYFPKPKCSIPPEPSEVLHKDEKFFNENLSETSHTYQAHKFVQNKNQNPNQNLRTTNFKMDSDLKYFDSFHTNHSAHFTNKFSKLGQKSALKDFPMRSFIPQGDPEKILLPLSNYSDHYRRHDFANFDQEKVRISLPGLTTIKGDQREHNFDTINNSVFKGERIPPIKTIQLPSSSNIPQGDPDKEVNMESINQQSFKEHALENLVYNKDKVTGMLRATNFKQNDGKGLWDTYASTMTDSYQPNKEYANKKLPLQHRNHSDFPQGDTDQGSNTARFNMTTNRFYHSNTPKTLKPTIESGANKRTRSNVWFGEPRQNKKFYETTINSNFLPYVINPEVKILYTTATSSVPMNYYGNQVTNPTYFTDYQNPNKKQMSINPEAIKMLKQSHIVMPINKNISSVSTENLDQYTPKQSSKMTIDPGKLQRSSLLLGSLPT